MDRFESANTEKKQLKDYAIVKFLGVAAFATVFFMLGSWANQSKQELSLPTPLQSIELFAAKDPRTGLSFAGYQRCSQKPLPYPLNGLEPVVSGYLMSFHYEKHHAGYVSKLNTLIDQAEDSLDNGDVQGYSTLLKDIKFNAGGHFNHEFFWETLAPIGQGGGEFSDDTSKLTNMIIEQWGSMSAFQEFFKTQTGALQGSGWGWLLYNKNTKSLEYRQTPNQDQPSDLGPGMIPLLTIDVWEHAYYLDYQNLRPTFLAEIWQVVNWAKVASRLQDAIQN